VSSSDWTIIVRDSFRNRIGELDDYGSLSLKQRFNDVSTWQLEVDRRNRLAPDLCSEGAGIIVERFGEIVFSGYWTDQQHERSATANTVTLTGVDDTGWLNRRLAYPDPNDVTPPYTSQAADVRTGAASDIISEFADENGGLATPVGRRIPGLFVPVSGFGPTLTNSGRWQLSLPLLQEIALASEVAGTLVGFRIVQSGTDLLFDVYAPADLTSTVRLSIDTGTLAGFSYKRTAPTMTYAIVGGDGEGTARTIVEKQNGALIGLWGRIEGDLVDARNAANATELGQAADTALAEGAGTTSLSITPVDTDTQRYGVHYSLGDKVTVIVDTLGPNTGDGAMIQDVIREVAISLTPEKESIVPAVGDTNTKINPMTIFGLVKKLGKRVVNIERR
jgi:hypothetical protein